MEVLPLVLDSKVYMYGHSVSINQAVVLIFFSFVIIYQTLDIRDTQVTDSDIQCFNVTTSLREILMECPLQLRDKASDKNPSDATAGNDAEPSSSKDIVKSQTKSTDSDVETGSETDGEDSDEEEEEVVDDKNGVNEENANAAAAGSSNQNHYIQVIIHDGNLVNVNNGQIPADQMQRARANGLRYMVGVVNGEGKSFKSLSAVN